MGHESPFAPGTAVLSKRQAALYCGLSVKTIERFVASGVLPVVRFTARCIRIRKCDLEKLIQERLIQGGASL